MAYRCEICSKGIMYGHNVSHSKRRTNRVFKPNLQSRRVVVDGTPMRIKVCTNCIKLMNKRAKEAAAAQESAAPQADTRS